MRGTSQSRHQALMRIVLLLLGVGVGGCIAAPSRTDVPSASTVAHLAVGARVNYGFVPGRHGVLSVDGRAVPGGPVRELRVMPGQRTIGYACPGWITVDGPARLSRTFAAGGRYELTCEDPPAIKQIPGGA